MHDLKGFVGRMIRKFGDWVACGWGTQADMVGELKNAWAAHQCRSDLLVLYTAGPITVALHVVAK